MVEYNESESTAFITWKTQREDALEAHRRHFEDSRDLFRSAIDFGLETIRTTALINGGAVVVCLAFVGALYNSEQSVDKEIIYSLLVATRYFVYGVVAAGVASGFAYFTQTNYRNAHDWSELNWEHPYKSNKPESEQSERWAKMFHIWTGCLVALSYVFILAGLHVAIPTVVE